MVRLLDKQRELSLMGVLFDLMYENMDIEKQKNLYAKLISEMRKDLYGRFTSTPDSIMLTTFKN